MSENGDNQAPKLISIEDINPDEVYEKSIKNILNSPRSLEACRRQGIDPTDLDRITEDRIREMIAQRERKKNIPKVLIEIRMAHYEEKRKERIRLIREERQNIIEEAEHGSKIFRNSAGNSLTRSQFGNGIGQSTILTDRKFVSTNSFTQPATGSIMMMSQSQGMMQSAMLEKEKRELEKIKFRQKKDLEQMMEYELKMEQIRQRNEEKVKLQRDKEERRRLEIAKQQKEAEERKRLDEEKKREKMEQEALEQKKRAEEMFKRDMEKAEKQRQLEIQKKREALLKEEERRKKQKEFQMQTEKILAEQQRAVDQRKHELEKRDQERREFMYKKQIERQRLASQKREQTEKKIEQARQVAELTLQQQRKQFEDRNQKVESKRKMFEQARERERIELQQRSIQKQTEIQKVIEQNLTLEEQRKQQIRELQRQAEERQAKLSTERQRDLQQKRKIQEDKERHSLEVRKQMEVREFARVDHIKKKREDKDVILSKTQTEREWQHMLKREMELIRREEKVENVARIAKAQEYQKHKVLEKIQYDNQRSEHLRREKEKLLDTRFAVRREADKQKQQIVEAFEMMKKKGRIDNGQLRQFGLELEIKEDPHHEAEVNDQDLQAVKERQSKELKQLMDTEKTAEQSRLQKIETATDETEKQKLQNEHDQAMAFTQDRIAKLQLSHLQELKVLTQE